MNDLAGLLFALAAGLALGALFFGGLWWTVSRLAGFERPALMVVASLLLRTGIAVAGFFLVSSGHWQRLLACLAGFALARLAARWALRHAPAPLPPELAP
jgi:F1F0 ATPase subunit 2